MLTGSTGGGTSTGGASPCDGYSLGVGASGSLGSSGGGEYEAISVCAAPDATPQASTRSGRTRGRGVTGASPAPTTLVLSQPRSHARVNSIESSDAPASHSI